MTIKELTTAVFETVHRKQVVCTGATGTGEYTARKTVGNVVLRFTGCALEGVKCSGTGAPEGELVSGPLEGSLGLEKRSAEGPLKDKVARDLHPVGGTGPFMQFTCGLVGASVRGGVLGPVATNRMITKGTFKYSASAGKQKPEGFEGLPKEILEIGFGEAAFEQAALKLTVIQASEEPVEVNSVA